LQVIKQLMDQADDQMDANDFAGAAATIQEALHLDPNNQRARMAAEEKERKQRNFEQIRELQRQGEEAMEGGDPDKALALFDEALALARKACTSSFVTRTSFSLACNAPGRALYRYRARDGTHAGSRLLMSLHKCLS
jgi:tetratricopeptide (TPR) repeat protein